MRLSKICPYVSVVLLVLLNYTVMTRTKEGRGKDERQEEIREGRGTERGMEGGGRDRGRDEEGGEGREVGGMEG